MTEETMILLYRIISKSLCSREKVKFLHYQTVHPLKTHQSDKSVQSDLSSRHYMMNMVRPWHKGFFVWPWSEGHSELQTASQGGSKWPKGPHQKKEKPNLCSTMVHANDSNPATPPSPPSPAHIECVPVRSSEV